MAAPQTPEELDDLPLDLPRSDGSTDDDSGNSDADDLFDDEQADDKEESIGLDVSVGFDQDADLDALIDDADAEDRRWTEGSEAASEQVAIDTRELAEGDEYGWTTDNDAAGDAVAHRDDELDDGDLPQLGVDAGEGLDEEPSSMLDDDADLPPIDATAGDVNEADDGLLVALGDNHVGEHEPERIEVVPGVYWEMFAATRIRSVLRAPVPQAVTPLFAGTRLWMVDSQQALILSTDENAPQISAPGRKIASIIYDSLGESLVISTETGLWQVRNGETESLGGPSADPLMIGSAEVAMVREGSASRLWAMSRLGSLFARKADPARWSLVDSPRPGRHLAADGRRAMAYVHAPSHRPCALRRSLDAGATWQSQPLPVSDGALVRQVLVCRDVVVVVCDSMTAPVQAWLRDEEPLPLVDGLRAPLTLVYEDGEVALYGCVVLPDSVALVRVAMGTRRRKPTVVRTWSAAEGMPSAIAGTYDGEHTQLAWVRGTELEWIALEIQRDGGL